MKEQRQDQNLLGRSSAHRKPEEKDKQKNRESHIQIGSSAQELAVCIRRPEKQKMSQGKYEGQNENPRRGKKGKLFSGKAQALLPEGNESEQGDGKSL